LNFKEDMMEEKEKNTEPLDIPTHLRLNSKSKDKAEAGKEKPAGEQPKTGTTIDPITLVKMLEDFQADLKKCMENTEPLSGAHQPILLGNFIVDAYNGYLRQAKEILTDPIIQAMNEIDRLPDEKLQNAERQKDQLPGLYIPEERLGKMHEVAIACRQLTNALVGALKDGRAGTHSELVGAMALLVNFSEQIEKIGIASSDRGARGFIRQLAEQYNSTLKIVVEATEDAVLAKLFQPLEIVSDDAHFVQHQEMFYRLKIAINSLTGYLKTRHGRSG